MRTNVVVAAIAASLIATTPVLADTKKPLDPKLAEKAPVFETLSLTIGEGPARRSIELRADGSGRTAALDVRATEAELVAVVSGLTYFRGEVEHETPKRPALEPDLGYTLKVKTRRATFTAWGDAVIPHPRDAELVTALSAILDRVAPRAGELAENRRETPELAIEKPEPKEAPLPRLELRLSTTLVVGGIVLEPGGEARAWTRPRSQADTTAERVVPRTAGAGRATKEELGAIRRALARFVLERGEEARPVVLVVDGRSSTEGEKALVVELRALLERLTGDR